ncbi:MAG: hypothetical protein U0556_11170 [Dehalococcoidia bacterium]
MDEIAAPRTPAIHDGQFAAAYGERLSDVLDLATWRPDEQTLYERLQREVAQAVEQGTEVRRELRERAFRTLHLNDTTEAGHFQVTDDLIRRQHFGLLFNGAVEACDATMVEQDSLVLTVTSFGVVLASYHGDLGTFSHRLFRRDLRLRSADPVGDVSEILNRRHRRDAPGIDPDDRRDQLSLLGQRGVMAYIERKVLLEESTAAWRMGHGVPVPLELLTGSGSLELLARSLELLSGIIDYRRFVFVPSAIRDRTLLTLGDALNPLEYAVVETLDQPLRHIVKQGRHPDLRGGRALAFVEKYGKQVARGVYRASAAAPAQVFYGHVDRIHEAAMIAMADSVMQEHRGFPLLIDMADRMARGNFPPGAVRSLVQTAYAEHDAPFRYTNERETR